MVGNVKNQPSIHPLFHAAVQRASLTLKLQKKVHLPVRNVAQNVLNVLNSELITVRNALPIHTGYQKTLDTDVIVIQDLKEILATAFASLLNYLPVPISIMVMTTTQVTASHAMEHVKHVLDLRIIQLCPNTVLHVKTKWHTSGMKNMTMARFIQDITFQKILQQRNQQHITQMLELASAMMDIT